MNIHNSQQAFRLPAATNAYAGDGTVTIGGLPIAVVTRNQTAEIMLEAVRNRSNRSRPLFFTSANGEVIARLNRDPQLANVFGMADQIVADGQPMVLASRYLCRQPLPERVATTDLFHDVARRAEQGGESFYLLGATDKDNSAALAAVRQAYPRLNLLGGHHGYLKGAPLVEKLDEINALSPDILWLGMGVPNEQQFVVTHGHRLDRVGLIKTSGGLFNFLSGTNRRAPGWMQKTGFEWAYRLALEPKRLAWRYLSTNPQALFLILTRSQ